MKKTGGARNDQRKNGKAWKKRPKKNRLRGKTVGGYSLKKLAIRKANREYPKKNQYDANAVNGDLVGDNAQSANDSEG